MRAAVVLLSGFCATATAQNQFDDEASLCLLQKVAAVKPVWHSVDLNPAPEHFSAVKAVQKSTVNSIALASLQVKPEASAAIKADWHSVDLNPAPEHVLSAKAIALQKSLSDGREAALEKMSPSSIPGHASSATAIALEKSLSDGREAALEKMSLSSASATVGSQSLASGSTDLSIENAAESAALSEDGYSAVAALGNRELMRAYVRRVAKDEGLSSPLGYRHRCAGSSLTMKLLVWASPRTGLVVAWILAQVLPQTSGLVARRNHTSSLLSKQDPGNFRCALPTAKCQPFGADCKKDVDCFSNHCYQEKCGYAKECSVNGELCRHYSDHTCCSGKCRPVTMVDDCHRLLGMKGSPALEGGVNVNRQCQNLGVCEAYDSSKGGKSALSTPWSVPATDLSVKYATRGQLTFKEGSKVKLDFFVARRSGQTYDKVPADSMKPGGIRDAGVIVFTDDSKVAPEMGKAYSETDPVMGEVTYCVAPILQNGLGGGYYAVCKGQCGTPSNFKFKCDDALDPSVKSSLVIGAETEKYMQAQQLIEAEFGWKFHDKTKGITTPLPMFVRILKDYVNEALSPTAGYTYVPQSKVTQCVAPIMADDKQKSAEFWAAGTDCCDAKTGFKCGPVDSPSARSGERVGGDSSMLHAAVMMAEIRYGLKSLPPNVPSYWKWTEKILVPTPDSQKE